ncbi:aldehyde dehydrogenase [Fodinibius sp.]|uniref:aldehyde dehydrogenase n=1 Tax=Fodinibius sp. TaxID=1872440 RepID=UPI002ACEDEA8|nr:aldehyde dehydrogenase [Fodinibius sp.]MDZ7659937.1 aldehyde dehydrogenase [Fodinibius sp.]
MEDIVQKQKQFFNTGKTLDISFRKEQLRKLKNILKEHENEIYEVLDQDFQKPPFESHATELFVLYQEIDHLLSNIDGWAKTKKVKSSLINFPSKSYIKPQPYGVALVIAPWNYPVQLALNPVLGAIAAGNTVILKPSENAPHTSELLAKLINSNFDPGFFKVVEGDAETTQALLSEPLDYIFFTGSTHVGKIIMKSAAEQLTPLTLELGGKSPAIVDQSADLSLAAKRITWGKFINAGQTCVSPDYVYVHTSVHSELCHLIQKEIRSFYGDDPKQSDYYARIINDKHFDRLANLITSENIFYGGDTDPGTRYIEPTIMTEITWDDPVMQEEIFGPILPILSFDDLDKIISILQNKSKPLALYLFSTDNSNQKKVFRNLQFGGGCINDTVAHLGNTNLPFGGIGNSGFGLYHGKTSFDTFTHPKSIMKKSNWLDIPLRYPPYKGKLKWLKKLTKFL